MKRNENRSQLILDGNLSNNEAWDKYSEMTKWNDANIAIPLLFNFFHGTELILKGLILRCGGNLKEKNHKLSDLLKKLKECPQLPNQQLLKLFDDILTNNHFEDFFKLNNTTPDSFYEVFKYPEFKNGNEIKFWEIRYQGKTGLKRFIRIENLAKSMDNLLKDI